MAGLRINRSLVMWSSEYGLTEIGLGPTGRRKFLQSNRQTTAVLCALIAGLLVINTIAIVIISRQRMENTALRAQVSLRQTTARGRARCQRISLRPPIRMPSPPCLTALFRGVTNGSSQAKKKA